jgi:hypothetical protein
MQMIRKHLWIKDLLGHVKTKLEKIKDTAAKRTREYTLIDCLMSGLAIFGMKYSSLLKFDQDSRTNATIKSNLNSLYLIDKVPCDTQLRERLDTVDPDQLQRGLNAVITQLQRGKALEDYQHIDDYYLLPLDGTGYFSSHEVHCQNCCVKEHKDGSKTYYHQALTAVLVHHNHKPVFPVAMEFIQKQDGASKNDCELNAAKRIIAKLKTAHPHLKMRMLCDALYANGPFIKELVANKFGYIIVATQKNNPYLFKQYKSINCSTYKVEDGKRTITYKFYNQLSLNETHKDVMVNFVEYIEVEDKKVKFYSSWITDIHLTELNIVSVVEGARCRWHIENQTFNTLKNQGYNFEHNFGHGKENLSAVMAYLMMIAFAIDQAQELTSKYFELALNREVRKSYLWEKIKSVFLTFLIDSWETLYRVIIERPQIIGSALLAGP